MSLILWIATLLLAAPVASQPPTPESQIGFQVGEDFKIASWSQIVNYFSLLADHSDRIEVETLGQSTNGRPFIVATISDPANLGRKEAIKADQRKLADPRLLAEGEAEAIAAEGKAVILIGCNIHATEIASSQMSMELAHTLVTSEDPLYRSIRENVVVLLVPSLNPDGIDIVRDWYLETLGTAWEGTDPPRLYHPYTGHDNNRDWFMLTQAETRLMTRLLYQEWFPQIIYDVHQMKNNGARFFVPPFFDPLNPNIAPLLQRQIMLVGSHMAHDLQVEDKPGVITSAVYDMWWHGGFRSTPYRHNTVGILTEAASARIASPIFQTLSDLEGSHRGLPKYWIQSNFPQPWKGGWWRLRDIVDYELIAARSLLKLASTHRQDWLKNQVLLGQRAIDRGKTVPPYAYVVPANQHDPIATYEMLRILQEGGVELHRAERDFDADGVSYPRGSHVVLMAQPYRAHAKDLLERQRYPDRRVGGEDGPPERPYDVTGWTLPLQMGVRTVEVVDPFDADLTITESALPSHRVPPVADGYFLANTTNNDVIALNRLTAKGYNAYWTNEERQAGSQSLPTGALFFPAKGGLATDMTGLAAELGIQPFTGKKPARGYRLRKPRLGLYQPYASKLDRAAGAEDEGWTRWVLERYEFDYSTLYDAEIRAGDLNTRYDVILLPNVSLDLLLSGNSAAEMPPRYTGGIGDSGADELVAFVHGGGTLICMGNSTEFALERLDLVVEQVESEHETYEPFYAPGSILQVVLDETHPLGFGRTSPLPIYFAQNPVFEVSGSAVPVATYPNFNPLMSGWIHGDELIRNKTALVDAPAGKGRAILFGFRPQHRAQTHATFKLLFNAIYYGNAQPNARIN
jgi:hypothetical protein